MDAEDPQQGSYRTKHQGGGKGSDKNLTMFELIKSMLSSFSFLVFLF